jgi:LacI family gluconate utilization system Gnt-I transcriptional repressor
MAYQFVTVGYRRSAFIGGDAGGDTRGSDRRLGFIETMQSHASRTFPRSAHSPNPSG